MAGIGCLVVVSLATMPSLSFLMLCTRLSTMYDVAVVVRQCQLGCSSEQKVKFCWKTDPNDVHRRCSAQECWRQFHVQMGDDDQGIWNGDDDSYKMRWADARSWTALRQGGRMSLKSAGSRTVIGGRTECPRTRPPEGFTANC